MVVEVEEAVRSGGRAGRMSGGLEIRIYDAHGSTGKDGKRKDVVRRSAEFSVGGKWIISAAEEKNANKASSFSSLKVIG